VVLAYFSGGAPVRGRGRSFLELNLHTSGRKPSRVEYGAKQLGKSRLCVSTESADHHQAAVARCRYNPHDGRKPRAQLADLESSAVVSFLVSYRPSLSPSCCSRPSGTGSPENERFRDMAKRTLFDRRHALNVQFSFWCRLA
jgi:hypothetical protein